MAEPMGSFARRRFGTGRGTDAAIPEEDGRKRGVWLRAHARARDELVSETLKLLRMLGAGCSSPIPSRHPQQQQPPTKPLLFRWKTSWHVPCC